MPSVNTKHRQSGQTLVLNFTIASGKDDNNPFISEPLNVNDLALVTFKFQHSLETLYTLRSSITLKTIAKTKSSSSTIKVKVTCEKFEKEWDCTGDWVETKLEPKRRDLFENQTVFSTLHIKLALYEVKSPSPQAQKFYEDEELIDFHLCAADGTVGIHKAFFAMQSDVFLMMLKREWKETLKGEIAIQGVTKQTLQDLKQYIYLGTLPDDGLEPLLVIAARYMMDQLKADCIAKMIHTITPETLQDYVEFACVNNLPDLMHAILLETPDSIVERLKKLKICNEEAKDARQ